MSTLRSFEFGYPTSRKFRLSEEEIKAQLTYLNNSPGIDQSKLDRILKISVSDGHTDVIFATDRAPLARSGEALYAITSNELTEDDTKAIASILLEVDNDDEIVNSKEFTGAEVAYEVDQCGRFRASIFKQRGKFRIVMRVIPIEIRNFRELGLPKSIDKILELKSGLVLITGATGQGKSTTIASVLEQINRNREVHIITIEDPIEFTYSDGRALVTQRELGHDVLNYQSAIRDALRQSPNIIMVGEIRDKDTFDAALMAAETGHLVISAIHTTDAVASFDRILGLYQEAEYRSLIHRLSNNLKHIFSLRLLPKKGSRERIPAVEVLTMNAKIRESLVDRKINEIINDMEKGEIYGMQSFDQHIKELLEANLIDEDVAMNAASRSDNLRRSITYNGN